MYVRDFPDHGRARDPLTPEDHAIVIDRWNKHLSGYLETHWNAGTMDLAIVSALFLGDLRDGEQNAGRRGI